MQILDCVDRQLTNHTGDVKKLKPPFTGFRLRGGEEFKRDRSCCRDGRYPETTIRWSMVDKCYFKSRYRSNIAEIKVEGAHGSIRSLPEYTVLRSWDATMGLSPFTSTFDLIKRFREGDQTAFNQLFTKYRPRLAVLIRYKLSEPLRQRVEVDDILQEVFLDASKDIGSFIYCSPGSFIKWLSRIADHVIVDEARSQARQKRHAAEMVRLRSASNPNGPEPSDSTTPSQILIQKQSADRLLARLDALPPDYRDVILMAKLEGLSSEEMAKRLGRSRQAVAVLLHRALQRLRALGTAEE